MRKRYWRILGHSAGETVCDEMVPTGLLSEGQVQMLLKCLVAQTLSPPEIIGALVKRKTKRANGLLDLIKNGPYPEYMCGSDPWYSATVVHEGGARVNIPPGDHLRPPRTLAN
jgi:hypothetical protein